MDKMVKKLRQESKDYGILEKVVKLEKEKTKLLRKISESFKIEIDGFFANASQTNLNALKSIYSFKSGEDSSALFNFHEKITEVFINTCSLFGKNATKKTSRKNYTYPKQQLYIYRLVGIYHQMTGRMPRCETGVVSVNRRNFRHFLYKTSLSPFFLSLHPNQ